MTDRPPALQDDEPKEPRRPVINKDTLVPITVVGAALFLAWSFMRYLDDRFAPLEQIDRRLSRIEERIEEGVTLTQVKMFELELRRLNPTVSVPDIWSLTGRRP